jgi:hypothetical protein
MGALALALPSVHPWGRTRAARALRTTTPRVRRSLLTAEGFSKASRTAELDLFTELAAAHLLNSSERPMSHSSLAANTVPIDRGGSHEAACAGKLLLLMGSGVVAAAQIGKLSSRSGDPQRAFGGS